MAPRELGAPTEELRFSLAGVQLKFSVVRAQEKVTLPVSGAHGDRILKLDSDRFPGVVENEYTVMRWAASAGFDVPECVLVETTALTGLLSRYGRPHVNALLVQRYDRTPQPVHQEDFAQVLNARPANKYGNISYEGLARLVQEIVGDDGVDELTRRLVLMIASGNADAHLKNWSLLYPDRVHATLAPLYDQVSTVAWPDVNRKLALKLVGVRQFEHVSTSTFERFADAVGRDRARVSRLVDDTLDRLSAAWDTGTDDWRMSPAHTRALVQHWSRVPLLSQRRLPEVARTVAAQP